ncbi:MAG: hypothetical protein M1358_15400 [Chloroflexi bacterium]|nr:hypothetical protein [Chloroflexota bacterium]
MAMPWYEWRNIRRRLATFGVALQGVSPYKVLVEPNPAKCPTGYCNFTRKEIAANPSAFGLPAKEQYQLTKAILVHEAGHRRFTAPSKLPTVVHQVSNMLEDERVERQMAEEFAGVRWLVKRLSGALYAEAPAINEKSDSPGAVAAYLLQLRWAKRMGLPVKGGLSAKNQKLWERVEPLVYGAWEAETSEMVDRNAEEIVNILGLKEADIPEWARNAMTKLGSTEGERTPGDEAEKASGKAGQPGEGGKEPEAFDGDVLPSDGKEGSGVTAIEPKPYVRLEERVRPLVQELIDELSIEERPNALDAVERGGRLSMKQYLRDHRRPFLSEEDQAKTPPTLALKVIVDHSTSLNYGSGSQTRMESVADATMALHLLCLELAILHEVIVTPQGIRIADLASGERGKALIAGLVPALCGHENMGLAIQTHAVPMVGYSQNIKLVLCLTDGACNDARLGKEMCSVLRGKVEVVGVLLDPDENTKRYVTDMFGEDRVIACRSEELPGKLGNVLRAIRGI